MKYALFDKMTGCLYRLPEAGEVNIGRGRNNDICLPPEASRDNKNLREVASTVSREHLAVRTDEHGIYVKDLWSKNRTYIYTPESGIKAPVEAGRWTRVAPPCGICLGRYELGLISGEEIGSDDISEVELKYEG